MENRLVLLFGFEDLPTILAVRSAVGPFGAEVRAVGRRDCALTLARLAGGAEAPVGTETPPMSGRMIVLCGLEAQVPGVLGALRAAGISPACPKAVLTESNRLWTPPALLAHLLQERAVIEAQRRGEQG